jgi:hypothetical protein
MDIKYSNDFHEGYSMEPVVAVDDKTDDIIDVDE